MDDDGSLIYTFKLKFSLNTYRPPNVHKTKLISCTVFYRRRNTRNKDPYLVYRRFNWRQRRYIRYKSSQLRWCFEFLASRVQLGVANIREHQILTLLLVHPTRNLSRIKFAHISRQVKGLCISWISLEGYRMKPSVSRQNQPWIRIKKNNNNRSQ